MKTFVSAIALIAGVSAADICSESNPLDSAVTTLINDVMCSEVCPCPIEAESLYTNLEGDFTFLESGKTYTTFNQCWTQNLSIHG